MATMSMKPARHPNQSSRNPPTVGAINGATTMAMVT